MCGIAGFVTTRPGDRSQPVLARMGEAIAHRGPDDTGYYNDQHAHLAHQRLSIVDLATGHQPIANETEDLFVIYNGEIFNHAATREELKRAGHVYKTSSDSETLLHAYEEFGPASLTRYRGMFAFVIWDRAKRTLFAARDRLGIKPFYYFWNGELFAFASEIKALLAHPEISTALDESALPEYFAFGYRNTETTLFRNIHKLPPGHWLRLDVSGSAPRLEIERFWQIPQPPEREERRDDASWIRECRERLEETVRMRLMSDVPLGMFLSGGVDSSAIAALMKGMVAQGVIKGPVQTFAVGYREGEFSELGFARQAAEAIGTEHHEVVIGRDEFFDALPRLIYHEDEPIVWPSSVSLYFVSKLAAERVKVVLTGEGSDELFGGYGRYRHYLDSQRWISLWSAAPPALRRVIASRISSTPLLSANLRRKIQHTVLGRDLTLESLYLDNYYGGFAPQEMQKLFAPVAGLNARYEHFLNFWGERSSHSLLTRMLYADQKTYLVELLMKQDQMSMACSLESRVPFLDHPFVEFSTRVPDRLKIRNGIGKYIVKEAVKDLLPASLLHRPKMGFPTPVSSWLLESAVQPLIDSLTDRDGIVAKYTDRAALESLIERHRARREDCTDRLWRLINLQIWGDLFLTGKRDRWMARPAVLAGR